MTPEDLRAEIVRLGPWHHDVELPGGLRTGEVTRSAQYSPDFGEVSLIRPDTILPLFLGQVYPQGLEGRSILDCACNAGGYLFAASDFGAGRRLGFDVRPHWIRQAEFLRAQRGDADVRFLECDLARLPERSAGRFDVTLFFGIFYHLPDPIAGLRIAADHTEELLVVNSLAAASGGRNGLVLNRESDREVMSGVDRLAWLPTGPGVLQEILAWCGFPSSRVQFDGAIGGSRRVQVLAARDESVFASYDAVHDGSRASRPSIARWLGWARKRG